MPDSKVEHYRECVDCQRAYTHGYKEGFNNAIQPTIRAKMLQFEPNIVDTRTPPSGGEEIGEDELINVIIDNIELKGGSINVPRAARAIIEYYRKEQP